MASIGSNNDGTSDRPGDVLDGWDAAAVNGTTFVAAGFSDGERVFVLAVFLLRVALLADALGAALDVLTGLTGPRVTMFY